MIASALASPAGAEPPRLSLRTPKMGSIIGRQMASAPMPQAPDLARLRDLAAHPAIANTNAMFGFPFRAMPVGKTPADWGTWAGQVQDWAKGLGPQVQSWAQTAAPLPTNPFVWPPRGG